MTKKGFMKKLALVLTVIAVLCFAAFTFIACSSTSSTEEEEKTYSYTNEDTSPISNMDFEYAMDEVEYSSLPYSTSTWSRSLDSSAKTSQVNSGIIDVSEDGWNVLTDTLYNDVDFRGFAGKKYSSSGYPTTNEAKASAITAYYTQQGKELPAITDDNIDELMKEFIISTFATSAGIVRPVRDGMTDTKVYMLNNYMSNSSSEFGFGTAQVITSSSSVTLEKGKYAKLSVYIMTQSVSGQNADGEYGANIRITNSINGKTQAQYRINNIVTNGAWKEYTLYIHADEKYDTTFTLVLGLGYGSGSNNEGLYYTEGTVYFDSISYEVLDDISALEGKTAYGVSALNYGGENPINNDARFFDEENNYYYYDLTMDAAFASYPEYVQDANAVVSGFNTVDPTGKTAVSIGYADDSVEITEVEDGYKVAGLNYTAYSVKLESEKFALDNGEYAVVSFKIKNALNKLLGTTNVKVSIYDKFGDYSEKREGLVSVDEVSGDYKEITIIVKNNFADEDNDGRTFYILVEIGPTNGQAFTTLKNRTQFACGEVYITSPVVAKGNFREEDVETEELYNFLTAVADKEQALFAGYTADYEEDEEESKSYAMTPSSGNLGEITAYPTNLQNYQGIVANHIYVKDASGEVENAPERTINTRSGMGDNGSFAGLINTKYLENYADNIGLDIASAINGAYTDDIQTLMVYNKNLDHYGYIGESTTLSASTNSAFTVKVRVVGDAKAYIYLVNTANEGKNVLEFVTFTSSEGTTYAKYQLKYALVIDSSMMEDDGWLTVSFYIANGKNEKTVRLEMWNGGRNGEDATASQGYVFFSDVTVSTSAAFTEPTRFADTFIDSTTPLGKLTRSAFSGENDQLITYTYGEDAEEIGYVWVKNDYTIYSVLNTIEPAEEETEEESEEAPAKSGCTATTDASTFWLSFSSILLAVVLVLAIIALFVKNIRRRKGSKAKVQSHYKVESRNKMLREAREKKAKAEEPEEEESEESTEEPAESVEESEEVAEESEEKAEEQTLDEYVYGEVTDFGETETNEEKTEETAETENKDE